MAIASSDKLVVVKAFAMGNPLPLDAREIYDSMEAAQEYAANSAVAYAGQTIKVVENGTVSVFNLVPSTTEGEKFKLQLAVSGTGAVYGVTASATEGNVAITVADGEGTKTVDVPVVGSLVNPVVNEEEHTLTLTKVGATPDKNTEVVVPLGGASPETIVSAVEVGEDTLTIKVTTFDVEAETESTETLQLFGAVTGVDASVAGVLTTAVMGADGQAVETAQALVGSVINAAYDATTKVLTLPVVTAVAADGTATTTPVSVDLKAAVAGMFVNVAHTADTETASAKYEFTYKDAAGADQTKTVYETGVRKVEAGSTVDKIKVTVADTTGALTSTELLIGAGSVKNPTYEEEGRVITLPVLQADGTTEDLVIDLGKDMVVKSGVYNAETKEIELTLTDGSVVKVPATALVDIYTGDATNTATVAVGADNKITAQVKISTVEKNILKSDENGLYVVEADFTDTKQLIVDAEAAAKQYTDDEMAEEVTARNEAIATAKGEAIEAANGYTDGQIAAEVEARNGAIATAKGEANTYAEEKAAAALKDAKDYADQKSTADTTATTEAIAGALAEAKKYTDDEMAEEVEARNGAIATAKAGAIEEANGYTDGQIAAEAKARDEAIATAKSGAEGVAKAYTDEQVATAKAGAIEEANGYTDGQIAAEVTARDTAIGTAKTEVNNYTDGKVAGAVTELKAYSDANLAAAKAYTDEKVAAAKTAWVDFGA